MIMIYKHFYIFDNHLHLFYPSGIRFMLTTPDAPEAGENQNCSRGNGRLTGRRGS